MEIVINSLVEFFARNVILFSPLAGFLSEDILLFLVVIASLNNASIWSFFIISILGFIGILVHDILLYYLSNREIINKLDRRFRFSKGYLTSFINQFSGIHYITPLIFSKFIYGIRTAAVILVSKKEKKFTNFLFYDSIATLVWLIIMFPLGWLTGQGFSFLIKATRNIEYILAIVFVLFIIIYLVSKIFKRKVKEYQKIDAPPRLKNFNF